MHSRVISTAKAPGAKPNEDVAVASDNDGIYLVVDGVSA